jgi:PAS domain-containing protein
MLNDSITAALQRLARRAGSLKFRIALMGRLLVGASVAVTVLLVLDEVGRRTEQVALDSSLDQTRRMARLVSVRIANLQHALQGAAGLLPAEPALDAPAADAFLVSQAVLGTLFSNLFVGQPDGTVLAWRSGAQTQPPGRSLADRPYFQQMVAHNRPVVSDAQVGRFSNEPVIVLTMPVRDASGRVAAVLGGVLRLSSRGLLVEVTEDHAGDLSMSVVTDDRGYILAHPDNRWLLGDAAAEPRLAAAVAVAAWTAQGRPVDPAGDARRAGDQVVAIAGVPDARWVLFRTERADVMLGGLAEGRQRAMRVGALVALVGGTVLLLVTVVLFRPLRKLERRAHRLLDENLADDAGWPRASGELGRLSHVFRHVMRQRAAAAASSQQLLAKMQAVMARVPLGVAFTRDKRIEVVSAEFNRLFGYADGELVGEPTGRIYISQAAYEATAQHMRAAFAAGRPVDQEGR